MRALSWLRGACSKTLKLCGLFIFLFFLFYFPPPPLVVQFSFRLRCRRASPVAGPEGAAEAGGGAAGGAVRLGLQQPPPSPAQGEQQAGTGCSEDGWLSLGSRDSRPADTLQVLRKKKKVGSMILLACHTCGEHVCI